MVKEKDDYDKSTVVEENDWVDVDAQNNEESQTDDYVVEGSDLQNNNGVGEWVEMHGNYVLRPPLMDQEPRALIHFLGGAIVGAAPDISYRYVLERLAEKGFLIVATPYTLSFDYIATCDDIIGRFERIAPTLARQFGPVPVVGVGHSCGALLQLLITTLFPDTPRAANALLSYNNKSVKEAIPLFDEVITPIFVQLGTNQSNPFNDFIGGSSDGSVLPPNSLELINIGIKLSRNAVKGDLPSDELLSEIAKRTTPKPLASILPQDVVVPSFVRDSFQKFINPLKENKLNAGIIPLLDQSLDVLEQIPLLIDEVANGARDFNPPPQSVQAAARRRYRARRTLVVQYDDDPLDESEQVETLLREAETVMRNKRPMVDFDVKRVVLKGGHATPCLAPPLDLASRVEDILGEDAAKNRLLYAGADETVDEIVKWLEEG
eukprot:CAMPEP_0176483796 /NCGR_PEP_ID=MMETSP0200_2-20121128/4109_1 /TAXON_ID=947934 /ORGANISM="Chaetoceros sp., Strain GSL56" /LENGTH=434 /DNA_ID=CAMNT_0017880221 /DNA_START=433 /DNA_END=1733 /DNA_ORIENTATION=+